MKTILTLALIAFPTIALADECSDYPGAYCSERQSGDATNSAPPAAPEAVCNNGNTSDC